MNPIEFRQEQIRRFVEDHIIMNANRIVDEFTRQDSFIDSELYIDLFQQTTTSIKKRVEDEINRIGADFGCPDEDEDEEAENNNDESECDEDFLHPLEFYFVSERLARRLYSKGALISEELGTPIWGRETTGQGIHLDSIIEEIFDEMCPAKYDPFKADSVWSALKNTEWLPNALNIIKSFQQVNGLSDNSLLELYEADGANLKENIRDIVGVILAQNINICHLNINIG